MSTVTSPKTHNFDPNNYTTPEYKKKDGDYKLTDYQAGTTIRNWMHKNTPGEMLGVDLIKKVNQEPKEGSSTVTVGGKTYTFSEQEKAAFRKLAEDDAALFNRLDSGENGSHDLLIGEWDITAAIKNGRIHGAAQHSDDGHWRNRNKDMPPGQAAEVVDDFLSQKMGDNWTLQREDLRRMASSHNYWDKDKGGLQKINDPEIVRAVGVLLDNWDKVQMGEGNSVGTFSKKEIEKFLKL